MRAAVLHGPGDLRVEEIDEPAGEVLVEVRAATACGTDRKMLRNGHPILGDYPARFGHETAGVRIDTGERVLVNDSVACGACAPCRAGRAAICRAPTWVLGGFAERIAVPAAALHPIPDGLEFAGAAIRSAKPPSTHVGARQIAARPARHGPQAPQATESPTKTRSPVSTRTPAVSWPKRLGYGPSTRWPRRSIFTSVPHAVAAATRTSTSPGASATSSTRRPIRGRRSTSTGTRSTSARSPCVRRTRRDRETCAPRWR